MAITTETGIPWVMCKEDDAPDPVINTHNGFYCDSLAPNKPYKPLIWTEAWSGWFTEFGGPMHRRLVQDLAFVVVRFIQKRGSFVNYYMYHGGTNFGRTAGGPFVTTSYDYDAPIDEYGLIRQPKYGHLKELHRAIKMCEKALVSADHVVTSLGNKQQAHVYSSESGDCSVFLANYDTETAARVLFNNVHYNLPPWSISILPDCRNAVFNIAKECSLQYCKGWSSNITGCTPAFTPVHTLASIGVHRSIHQPLHAYTGPYTNLYTGPYPSPYIGPYTGPVHHPYTGPVHHPLASTPPLVSYTVPYSPYSGAYTSPYTSLYTSLYTTFMG